MIENKSIVLITRNISSAIAVLSMNSKPANMSMKILGIRF